ncbi:MAG: hypothetical protein ACRDQW_16560 [Haloechinothrix sp.]
MGRGPVAIQVELEKDADLAKPAKAVSGAATPHREKVAPALALVVFAKEGLEKEDAQAARKALRGLKGVDTKRSRVNAKTGEISVAISGEEKVTAAQILAALKKAGIDARLTKA